VAEIHSSSGGDGSAPLHGDSTALSHLVADDVAWNALVAQLDAAHERMNELAMLRMERAPADLRAQLQKARGELNDAEQAMLSFVSAIRRARSP
jgi:hypothetical protein